MSSRPQHFDLDSAAATPPYRRLILVLIIVGAAGLFSELLLLEHYDDPWQWAPLTLLVATMTTAGTVWRRPSPRTLGVFRTVMMACVVFGVVGVVLHLKGNLEFELEGDPAMRGWPLYRETLKGATPALAPGALVQLGLLGLLFTLRHPVARGRAATIHNTTRQEPT